MRGLHARVELDPATRRRALWGFGLMAGGSVATLLATALASVLACSPGAAAVAGPVAATSAPAALPGGPPPPDAGLPMPALDLDWRPPSAAAGDTQELALALAKHARVGLFVDPGVDADGDELDAMRVAALVGRLAPDTAVHSITAGPGGLAELIREDPPLMPATSERGRTHWTTPDRLELDVARLHGWAELGDPAVLVVGAVGVDTPVWRQLSAGAAVGSCDPLFAELLEGQRQSLALLEPFLDHADEVLATAYASELAAVVPELEQELAEFGPERERTDFDGPGWERYQCGRRYLEYLQPFAGCVAAGVPEACPTTPRLFLRGSARIGSIEPSEYIPSDCPRRLDRDYVEALRAPARAAAELAGDHLDLRWMILAERLATLSEVYGALEQLCTPARRRFVDSDLDALRAQVAALGPLFTRVEEPAHDARFLANDANFHVPGVGKVRQLARYDGGTDSASRALIAAAKQLSGFARAHGRCVARPGDPPLMAMLIDTRSAAPEFLGFYYAEELWCGELGPL
ncbi:hypothetical protein [Enhygromyxa salina]|nr:hypothetical protein [Enhygromyxa salina]